MLTKLKKNMWVQLLIGWLIFGKQFYNHCKSAIFKHTFSNLTFDSFHFSHLCCASNKRISVGHVISGRAFIASFIFFHFCLIHLVTSVSMINTINRKKIGNFLVNASLALSFDSFMWWQIYSRHSKTFNRGAHSVGERQEKTNSNLPYFG